jgi:stringent starvation protein B
MSDPQPMTNLSRHFVPAYHAWLSENGLTPHITVFRDHPGLEVPASIATHDRILALDPMVGICQMEMRSVVLNLALRATSALSFTDAGIFFSARFSGKSEALYVPYTAIASIYAREDHAYSHYVPHKLVNVTDGVMSVADAKDIYGLSDEEAASVPAPKLDSVEKPAKRDRSHLSVVRS